MSSKININKRNEYIKEWIKKYQNFDSHDFADSYEEFFGAIIEIYNKGFEDGLQKGYDMAFKKVMIMNMGKVFKKQ